MIDHERIDGRKVVVGERAERYPTIGLTVSYDRKIHAEKHDLQNLLQRLHNEAGIGAVSMLFYQQDGWQSESEPDKWDEKKWSYITAVWKYGGDDLDDIEDVDRHLRRFRGEKYYNHVTNSSIKAVEQFGDEKIYF